MYIVAVKLEGLEWPVNWVMDSSDTCKTVKFLEEANAVNSYNVTRMDGSFVDVVNEFAFEHKFIKKG